ncbi:methionine--tRNA ligase [Natrarchaeobius oligotrophus]|uniref:methionine--tRNA ligase n=1 Tax=Natrarchaeobius chitinivorans TaxID=1679083 RepID=A0A3N6PKF1_NATCH|nr:methionine--tRNA ligase [Natrarchaeobius chitinivorans]RQG99205.1 methionine--tRNA ligase [Natrarchaeobius chitinivorans]
MTRDPYPTSDPAVVTCGLPYANGDLHIGHFRTYVAGDTFSRALELLGQKTAFVCGSDMHGTPVTVNAEEEEDTTPEEFAYYWHERIESLFPRFNVEFDNYGNTHDEENRELTKEFVRTLEAEGHLVESKIKVAWDPVEEMSLPDRYVEGECPYCGERARGDECDEGCQRHLEPGEIENPVSTVTGNPAEYREESHKFFRLSDLQEYLQEFIDRLEGTENAKNQPREWIYGELEDWCITRDMDWGVDYPGEPPEGQDDLVLYVWVDAPTEYITSTMQYSERVGPEVFDWEEAWQEDGEIVHVIGRDIIQHHTVFWPAMLRAVGYNEPRAVLASGFMTLDGAGFSTSRNRAVWAEEYLDEGFHPDLLRYYLITNGNFQKDIDFSWPKFQQRVNSDIVDTVGNFAYRSLLFAHREFGGTPNVECSDRVIDRIEAAIEEFRAAVNDYDIREIGTIGVDLTRFGNQYIQNHEPWNLLDEDPEQAAQVVRDCVQLVKAGAVLLAPVAPEKMAALWEQLGEDDALADATIEAALAPPAEPFEEPTEPFESIEDDHVAELEAQLADRIESRGDEAGGEDDSEAAIDPLSDDRISFEEFQDFDMRVGRIETTAPIENADKLAHLEIDVGTETRQVVAGIREFYDLEDLIGERVVVLVNLEPTELFGVESNGMLLAAGDQADLLTTIGDAEPGERIQ